MAAPERPSKNRAPQKNEHKRRLRLVSFNVWHGLDHTSPNLMLPAEGPLQYYKRKQSLFSGLKEESLSARDLTVFCLQELNPVDRLSEKIKKKVGLEGFAYGVNVGLRLGNLSYPFFLQEGLGTLWKGGLQKSSFSKKALSGQAFERQLPLGVLLQLHLSERRAATCLTGSFGGLKLAFINLHTHSGRSAEAVQRRGLEIINLLEWAGEIQKSVDAVFLVGDFNAQVNEPEMNPILQGGFEQLSEGAKGEALLSWNPEANPICKKSSLLSKDVEARNYDAQKRSIDHVFLRWTDLATKAAGFKSTASLTFNDGRYGVWPSDHLGLRVDIEWNKS